ncbi:MAG: alpha-2-macroglobulin, partial [Deltaproteobacteria bacterium]|nr:alpha-2-macroglobulin [Deltaproteobacteria bacterium]
ASGVAEVTFKLPGNPTIWVATAVAADAAGRFGESTAEFQSRADLMLVASLPQFLRAGDQAQGSVRVASAKKASKLDLHVESSGALKAGVFDRGVEVAAKGEQVVPVALVAAESGRGRVSLRMTSDGDMRTAGRDVRVEPAAVRQVLSASAYGGGDLELEVPKGAEVVRVELNLMPSSVAASLASVRNLLDYPYGCIEQLVATTIPNVAVYTTLKKVDAFGQLDPESQALLEEAYSRSVQGVHRIMQLATKSGGFTWFGGYSEASLPLTLIAVDGLTYAADAGLIKRGDPRLAAAASYLTKQDDLPFALDATRTYVLARLEGKKHAPRVRALLEKASGGDMYAVALATLAAREAGIMSEPGVDARVQALAEEAGRGMTKVADYRFEDAFWRYPLSRIGLTAILGHAASFAKADRAEARKRFVTALATAEELSTFDQSTVLLHNLWLIEEDAKAMREMKPPEVDAKGGAKLVPRGAGLAATLSTAATEVEVGSFDGIATLKAEVLVPLDKVEAKELGMKLSRRFWLIRPDGREPLKEGSSVAQGQFVFVELEVDAHDDDWRKSRRSSYYVIEEAIPAGFEPVSEDKRFRSAPYALPLSHEALKYRSLNPDRAQFFFEEPTWWSRSPRSVGYVMRAQFPGTFSIPPAKVSDMYAPQIMAQTKAASLTISAN